jgi:osmotically-inducible protein OsmY
MVFATADKKDIANAVRDQLRWDNSVDTAEISVEVREDGTAVLSGRVPTFLDKQSAGIDAMLSPGVLRVENRLVVSSPQNPEAGILADDEVRSRISNALAMGSGIDASRLAFTSLRGNVTLEGNVSSYPQLLRALDVVSRIIGIVHITNNVTVVPENDFPDELLARRVTEAFEKRLDRRIMNDIAVEVIDGVVRLDGAVPGREEWATLHAIVAGIEGIRGMENRLKVG